MTIPERSLFLRRTEEAFSHHLCTAHALGRLLGYGLHELRDLADRRLREEHCPYCRGRLTVADFRFDYRVPMNRAGRMTLRNLEVCCGGCPAAKGALDASEYRDLLALVATWPKPVACNFLSRLRAGTAVVGNELPRVGSLHWFTGGIAPNSDAHGRRDAQ